MIQIYIKFSSFASAPKTELMNLLEIIPYHYIFYSIYKTLMIILNFAHHVKY
jgi:hypothetical protein